MNKSELLELAEKLIIIFQKRDGINIKIDSTIIIYFQNKTYTYKLSELYLSIAIALKKHHSIPEEYLKYYLKINHKPCTKMPNNTQVLLIKQIIGNHNINQTFLAGGSMAQTVLIKGDDGNDLVIKKALEPANKKLANEINYLKELSKNPTISIHLPELNFSKIYDNSAILGIKYYPFETLSYKLLFGKIETKIAWNFCDQVLKFVKENLWNTNILVNNDGYIQNFFLSRIKDNQRYLLKIKPHLNNILEAEKIIINEEIYFGLSKIINLIEKHKILIKALEPPIITNIWGDLHLNNIIIVDKSFILIDPRGEQGDPMYDVAKIYHTIGPGRYDFIDNDLYFIEKTDLNSNIPKIIRSFQTTHPSWQSYEELGEIFQNNIADFINEEDINWEIRWYFINFCIFATMPPFLVKNNEDEDRVIMGYTNALIFGKKFLEKANQLGYELN